jgi:glycogen(starch) synthase
MGQQRIVFVSREVYPFDSAGLGNYVTFTAAALAPHAEVTIITSTLHEERYSELVAAADPRIPADVRFEFVPEPEGAEVSSWYGLLHLWGARVLEAIASLYPDGGPQLVEFPDYLGEGCVVAQAIHTLDPRLRHTTLGIRAYTTAEMCAVLDGFTPEDRDSRLTFDLERYALRHADHFIWPGGDVLESYRRFYGADGIAHPARIPHTVLAGAPPADPPADAEETRFLYIGRLERRKGVQNLIRAARSIGRQDWSLTLVGGDTPTAPLGASMRDQLELMIADDPRVRLLGTVPREELGTRFADAHVCISPSLWECWPNTVLEAFEHDRPVLATPVGGHVGMVDPGRSGWLAQDTGPEALADAIERVVDARAGAEQGGWLADGAPRARFDELTDPEPVVERYLELAAEQRTAPRARRPARALVTVVVPYYRMEGFVEEALASVRDQTYPSIEIVLVNDGSFRAEDEILEPIAERYGCRLITQPNSGLGQARNLGLDVGRGRYVLPLDPDDVLLPTYVERCVEVLDSRPEVAYVTAWSRYIQEDGAPHEGGYRPLGNMSGYLEFENVAGSAMSVFRRRLFERGLRYSPDLASYEDWLLFLQLQAAGEHGHVIPETLLLYRVRDSSMLREMTMERAARLRGELEAHVREREVEWMSSSV